MNAESIHYRRETYAEEVGRLLREQGIANEEELPDLNRYLSAW